MKENKSERKKVSGKSFYTALCICVAMVGFACYFAYTQTADRLSSQLDSAAENNHLSAETTADGYYNDVAGIQTSIPKDIDDEIFFTEPVMTEPLAAEETAAPETEPEIIQTTKRPAMKNTSYIIPVDGTVLCEFSNGELVKSATTGAWQTHNGVDISADTGTEIKSMFSGTVTSVADEPLWGICITIDHGNGISARYCGLSRDTSVEAGSEVRSGTVIGTAGDTCEIECESEPHIHFEVIKNGSYINPLEFINGIS